MTIHESAEDYLEAILRLQLEKGYARSVDVAMLLNVSKPSVSVAMKRLREDGYITMDDDHLLELTEKGREIIRQQNEYVRKKFEDRLPKLSGEEQQQLSEAINCLKISIDRMFS